MLLSSEINNNKLDIVARNSFAGVRTFIAKRDGGQDIFSQLDARKMMNDISETPEIYTLKPYKGNTIAVGANVINNDDAMIPVGLATSYSGDITLTFSGMDSYNANISLIDVETNETIDLTGLASYDYVVNYTPKKVNGKTAVCEDRFMVRISSSPTGLPNILTDIVRVFETNGLVRVHTGASNLIKEVAVYNLQGMLIYNAKAINAPSFTINRNWSAGMYIVKVTTEKNIDNVKLILK